MSHISDGQALHSSVEEFSLINLDTQFRFQFAFTTCLVHPVLNFFRAAHDQVDGPEA